MRVLVVDDEDAGRAYLRALLVANGYDVDEARDGAEALGVARARRPDVVISDILMPVMDGYRLCMELRRDEELHNIPLIFYTASYTDPADRDLADNMGADRFVLKPAEPSVLLEAIQQVHDDAVAGRVSRGGDHEQEDAATLKEYSERLVSKLEEKVLELQESNAELQTAQDLLSREMEIKNDLIVELGRDIELREQAERELREERDFTAKVIAAAELAIVVLDLDGRIELFSAGAERITGYSADQVVGSDWFERFIPGPMREYNRAHVHRMLASGQAERMTGVVMTSSGAERIVQWSDTLRRGDDGAVTGVVGFGLDVTARARRDVAEAVLARLTDAVLFEDSIDQAVGEFCARLLSTLPIELVAVVTTTSEGASIRGLADSGGGDSASSRGLVVDLAGRASIDGSHSLVSGVGWLADSPGDEASALVVPLAAFGEMAGALVLAGQRRDDFDEGLIGLLRSTADRLALVLLLAESQQQMRLQAAALDSATSAILVIDADGVLVWANPAFERLTGGSREDAVGHPVDLLGGREDDEHRAEFRQALLEGRALLTEIESVGDAGAVMQELVYLDPVRSRSGEVTHFVIVRQDITERKQLEQLKADFLSIVSHELRTPLTSIIGYTDLLLREAGTKGDERERLFAERIRSHGSDMQGLIEELLEVSQMQTDPAIRLNLHPCDIAAAIVKAATSVELPDICELILDIDPDMPDVICDADKIGHVVTNLVSNAVKYSPDGGPITVAAAVADNGLSLTVSDHGIGIAEEDIERVFERFTQADMSATREFGGFGLGLFIVKTLVQAHGGTISLNSELGKGSTFTVELPLGPSGESD